MQMMQFRKNTTTKMVNLFVAITDKLVGEFVGDPMDLVPLRYKIQNNTTQTSK